MMCDRCHRPGASQSAFHRTFHPACLRAFEVARSRILAMRPGLDGRGATTAAGSRRTPSR
jgi:hypothetical protein